MLDRFVSSLGIEGNLDFERGCGMMFRDVCLRLDWFDECLSPD
jgi:hypothetical protein